MDPAALAGGAVLGGAAVGVAASQSPNGRRTAGATDGLEAAPEHTGVWHDGGPFGAEPPGGGLPGGGVPGGGTTYEGGSGAEPFAGGTAREGGSGAEPFGAGPFGATPGAGPFGAGASGASALDAGPFGAGPFGAGVPAAGVPGSGPFGAEPFGAESFGAEPFGGGPVAAGPSGGASLAAEAAGGSLAGGLAPAPPRHDPLDREADLPAPRGDTDGRELTGALPSYTEPGAADVLRSPALDLTEFGVGAPVADPFAPDSPATGPYPHAPRELDPNELEPQAPAAPEASPFGPGATEASPFGPGATEASPFGPESLAGSPFDDQDRAGAGDDGFAAGPTRETGTRSGPAAGAGLRHGGGAPDRVEGTARGSLAGEPPRAADVIDDDMVDIDERDGRESWTPRPSPVGEDGTGEVGKDPLPAVLRRSREHPVLLAVGAALLALVVVVVVTLLLRPERLPGMAGTAEEDATPAQQTLLVSLLSDSGRIEAASLLAVDAAQLSSLLLPADLLLTVADAGRIPLSQTATLDARATSRGVEDTLGVRVDGDWAITAEQLAPLVDAAGGIVVDVDTQVQAGEVVVPVGQGQRLGGPAAAVLVSAEVEGEPTEARLDRFGDVVLALADALPQDPDSVTELLGEGGLVDSAGQVEGTALPTEDFAELLVEAAARSEAGDAAEVVVPTAELSGDEGGRGLDEQAASALLTSRLAGALLPVPEIGEVRVVVRNGVGTPGLVAAARDRLVEAELRFTGGGNAPSFDFATSEVLIPEDTDEARAQGEAVSEALGLGRDALKVSLETLSDTDVVVVLGEDFAAVAAEDGPLVEPGAPAGGRSGADDEASAPATEPGASGVSEVPAVAP